MQFRFLAKLLFLAACALGSPAVQAQEVIYYHTDALGSVVAVTDANGNVLERSEYEPYGQLLNRPLTDGPGFTGHVSDAQTGLSYMQQRYYDPGIGRFLSRDPVTADSNTGANFNAYWYANNNPYRFTDPDGRQSCQVSGKSMKCDPEVKGMPTITIPKPTGFPNKIDATQKNAHRYDKTKSAGPGTADKTKAIQQAIVNDPTPGADKPATPAGTANNATPTSGVRSLAPVNSPVLSYAATAPSGNTITMNVTLPGHPLHPGVVMRGAVAEGGAAVVHNVGIGTGILQSNAAFGDAMFNNVWFDHSQTNIDAAR